MTRKIQHQFTFSHPPDLVWEYLTNSELLAQWLMPNDFKPIVGHKFQFNAKPKLKFGFDGTVYCEVLEIAPTKKLVYSWKGGLTKDRPSLDSIVTWKTPSDNGTVLLLEHDGFKGVKNYLAYFIMNMGWLKIGKRLLKQLNTSGKVEQPQIIK